MTYFVVGFMLLLQAGGVELPEGKGKAQVQRICSQCHGLEVVVQKSNTEDGWGAVVTDMVSRGAQGSDADFDLVVKYLGAHFGPKGTVRASVESGGDPVKGKELAAANGCFGCHRVGETGSRVGPDLSDIGSRRTPERLRLALVAPDDEVLPENRFVSVVLKDGSEVKGRLLNHDAMSVQLIDAKEQLRSFETANIQEYTILLKGLMPSYEGKFSPGQVADVVAYLGSLKGAN